MLNDWTPIQRAGDDAAPIAWSSRQAIIHRLQDGLLIARAKLVVSVHRPKEYPDTSHIADQVSAAIAASRFAWGQPVEERETNVELPPSLWTNDRLGRAELSLWDSGEERLTDPYSLAPGYEGDRATFYGIELRDYFDTTGTRAAFPDAVQWCADWLARRRSQGLPIGEKHAWPEFRSLPEHIGMDRDNVFRPAFRSAKNGNF